MMLAGFFLRGVTSRQCNFNNTVCLKRSKRLPMTLVVLAEGGKVGRAQLIIDDSHSFLPRHSQVSHFCDKFMGLLF